jgi:hypothetical protein
MSWKYVRLIAQLLLILALLPGSFFPANAGSMIGNPTSTWTSLDINTATPGDTQESGFQLTLSGSGAGIGGTRDGFRYAYDELTGDLEIQAKVSSWNSAGSATARGGLMMRSSTNPQAAFALVALAGKKGAYFQWRSVDGGKAVEKSFNGNLPLPVWLKLRKSGSTFSAYYSKNGTSWSQIGAPVNVILGSSYLSGMAVTSGREGVLAQATFDSFQGPPPVLSSFNPLSGQVGASVTIKGEYLTGANQASFAGSPAGFSLVSPYEMRASVPEGAASGALTVRSPYGAATSSASFRVLSWTSLDIGYDYGDLSETVQQGDLLRVKASGWGVKDTSDGFRYVYESASGDLELTAYVASFSGFQASQAGVMLRSHNGPASAFAFLYTDPYGNLQYKWRTADGEQSQSVWLKGLTLPFWIRLVRYGDQIWAGYSLDGKGYLIASQATIALPNELLAGPATSSGTEREYSTAEYMYITIDPYKGLIIGGTGSP